MFIIINKGKRPNWSISFFRKLFIEELFTKFPVESDFWNKSYLDLYLYNKDKFFNIMTKDDNRKDDNRKYNNLYDNINTQIITNWRTNIQLIEYIKSRNSNKINKDKLFEDITYDDLYIIEKETDENFNIEFSCYGHETIIEEYYPDQVISDLYEMIKKKYNDDEILDYINKNEMYKYTKKFLKNPNVEDLYGDGYY
jgi:hypothetical protein